VQRDRQASLQLAQWARWTGFAIFGTVAINGIVDGIRHESFVAQTDALGPG
jgi:hypothetical protein